MRELDIKPLLDRARRLVEEGVAFYKRMPKAIALAEFSSQRGRFVKSDQYIYVLDSTGVMVAHPINETFVGQDFYYVTDCDGKSFNKEIVDTANAEGCGWVEYKWLDPVTRTERPKIVYFEKTHGVIICSGVYGDSPACVMPEHPHNEDAYPAAPADVFPPGDSRMETEAEERGDELVPDDARRFVEQSAAFIRANGTAAALAEFSNPRGRFVRGEQYIFVLDPAGVMLAHGVNSRYIGKNFYHILDADGRQFVKEIVDTANAEGSGWVEYKWGDPLTRTEQTKVLYFELTFGVIICSGIYRH
ncbi:cache domain-containing protein [Syntrophobacter fumaroxidans]|uniref:Cache, type 2 domain protein n=1 Tax=Syntrophobacter fumaroxidans (strain DSM 10017 / MPOB) TaxID=335543 RepID=A0LHP2_SYNFM|nr:cache domain-containing protein [Syntrophobacter fumaroxidans]ABK16944.1 Cache, type 2 domain protein [Syntrophobacter fumaroxidans MPOB]